MSVIRSEEKVICDICGEEINRNIWWYHLRFCTKREREKMDLCTDCWTKLKKAVREMKVE